MRGRRLWAVALAVAIAGGLGSSPRPDVHADTGPGAAARASAAAMDAPDPGVYFEANRGQTHPDVQFVARALGYRAYLAGNSLALTRPEPGSAPLRMSLRGGVRTRGVAAGRLRGVSHFLIGNDRAAWVRHVPHFRSVSFPDVRRGVGIAYRADGARVRFDLQLDPGVDPASIRLDFAGATALAVSDDGSLRIELADGAFSASPPRSFQHDDPRRIDVTSNWRTYPDGSAGFEFGAYDSSLPLTIDPTLISSTYLGGSDLDSQGRLAVDDDRQIYLGASTRSDDYPVTSGAYQDEIVSTSNTDLVLTKFDDDRKSLEYATYLGGDAADAPGGVAVDDDDHAYLSGSTVSSDFPLVAPYSTTENTTGATITLTKFADDGSDVEYSTFVGGGYTTRGLHVDTADQPALAFGDRFVSVIKLEADGQDDVFVMRADKTVSDTGIVIPEASVVDGDGNFYIAGITDSPNLPVTTGAFQTELPGLDIEPDDLKRSGFVMKVSDEGVLQWMTYLGGSLEDDFVSDIAVSAGGEPVVVGATDSEDFPHEEADLAIFTGRRMAYVTKLADDGESLVFSTFLGGDGFDAAAAVDVGHDGEIHLVGLSDSTDLDVTEDAYQDERQASSTQAADGLLARYSATGELAYLSYFGSTGNDSLSEIAVDCTRLLIVGSTNGDTYPTLDAFATLRAGGSDMTVLRIDETLSILARGLPAWTVGRPYEHQVEALGRYADLVFVLSSDNLPTGMTFSPSGLLSGTPTQAGTRHVVVRLATGCDFVERGFELLVNTRPKPTAAIPIEWTTGFPLDQQLASTGGTGTLAWSTDPASLPSGLTMDATGVVTGTTNLVGTFPLDVRIVDERGGTDSDTMRVIINALPEIETLALEECTAGGHHSWAPVARFGTPPYTWAITGGTLPDSVTVNEDATGLEGRLGPAGDYDVVLRVTDVAGATATRTATLHVNPAPEVTTDVMPLAAEGRDYAAVLAGEGGTAPFEWRVASGLPPGLVVDRLTGVVAGTPTGLGLGFLDARYTDGCGVEGRRVVPFRIASRFTLHEKKNVRDTEFDIRTVDEPVRYHFELLEGTELTVKARFKGKGEFPWDAMMTDNAGRPVDITGVTKTKKQTFQLKKFVAPATSRYFLEFVPTRTFSGSLSVSSAAKAGKKLAGAGELPDDGTLEIRVPVLAGATVKATVKAAKKSSALPEIVAARQLGADVSLVGAVKTKKKASKLKLGTPTAAGELTLVIGARETSGGAVTWKITVKHPKVYVFDLPGLAAGGADD